jgi:integrase
MLPPLSHPPYPIVPYLASRVAWLVSSNPLQIAVKILCEPKSIRVSVSSPTSIPQRSARKIGKDGFRPRPMTPRAVEKLIERYVKILGLNANISMHSPRVTALTTARERGCDIIDLQDFAGHADPRATLTYIRSRDRLSKSLAYVLKY